MSAIAKIIPSKLILIHIFQLAWNKVIQGKVHVILMTFFSLPGIIITIIITGKLYHCYYPQHLELNLRLDCFIIIWGKHAVNVKYTNLYNYRRNKQTVCKISIKKLSLKQNQGSVYYSDLKNKCSFLLKIKHVCCYSMEFIHIIPMLKIVNVISPDYRES